MRKPYWRRADLLGEVNHFLQLGLSHEMVATRLDASMDSIAKAASRDGQFDLTKVYHKLAAREKRAIKKQKTS